MRMLAVRMLSRRSLSFILLWMFLPGTNLSAQQENVALKHARELVRQGRNGEAIAQLVALETSHPGLKGISHELGLAYYHEREYLKAATYFQRALEENPEDRDAAQLLGLSYYSSGKPAEAIPPLEKVRLWHPNENIDAIYILGLCYLLTKDYRQARETYAQLYGLGANSAEAHLLLARMLLRQGFDPVARMEVSNALSISPRLPLAHFTLGELAVYKEDYAMAIQEFQAELADNPCHAPALTHLGDVYWHVGRYDDAERVLQRSIWLDSMTSEPYVIMGKVQVKKKQFAPAEQFLLRALVMDPSSYTAHYFLGQAFREQGKIEAAEREMKAAAQIQQQQTLSAPRN